MSKSNVGSSVSVPGLTAELAQALNGAKGHLPQNAVVVVGGMAYSPADLVKKLETVAAPFFEAQRLQIEAENKHDECTRLGEETRRFMKDLRVGIWGAIGRTSGDLVHFGFSPDRKTPRELTVAEKTLRAAKARATREARRTMGRRQKENVKGEVTSVTLSSDAAPSNGSSTAPPPSGERPAA